MRKSTIFLTSLAMEVGVLGLLLGRAASVATAEHTRLRHEAELVATLGLSDLCLFTEARYTRHLSQADLSTAFQDHPLSLDHFPSGSLVPPPARQSGSLVPPPGRQSGSLVPPPARQSGSLVPAPARQSGSLVPAPRRQSGSLVPAPRRHSASLVRPPARR